MVEFREDISRLIKQQWGNQMQLIREEIEEEFPFSSEIRIFHNGALDRSLSLDPLFYCLFSDELKKSLLQQGYEHRTDEGALFPLSLIGFVIDNVEYSLYFFENRCISRSFKFSYDPEKTLELSYVKGCQIDRPVRLLDIKRSRDQSLVCNFPIPRETIVDILRNEKEFPYVYRKEYRNGEVELVFAFS